jgi:hypothetical protein
MLRQYIEVLGEKSNPLSNCFAKVLAGGLIKSGEGIFLRNLFERCPTVSRADFPDWTGYECFVNSIHVDDFTCYQMVETGISFLDAVAKMYKNEYPQYKFNGILGADDNGVVVRFHTRRPNEGWLADNLEKYQEEGVAEFEG